MLEVGVEGVAEEVKNLATLLATRCNHRPDALTSTLSTFATGSLRHVTVDHEVPNLLLELGIRLFPGKHIRAKQVVLQNQRGHHDILVCHR